MARCKIKFLADNWWFSSVIMISTNNKTDLHDIIEILLIVTLSIHCHNMLNYTVNIPIPMPIPGLFFSRNPALV